MEILYEESCGEDKAYRVYYDANTDIFDASFFDNEKEREKFIKDLENGELNNYFVVVTHYCTHCQNWHETSEVVFGIIAKTPQEAVEIMKNF